MLKKYIFTITIDKKVKTTTKFKNKFKSIPRTYSELEVFTFSDMEKLSFGMLERFKQPKISVIAKV